MSAPLGWAGLATGLIGLVVYIVAVLRRPELVRVLNGSGLLLTALALTQARAILLGAVGAQAFEVQASVVLLILGVIAQSVAAVRNRRAWDGVDRRAGATLSNGGLGATGG